MAERDPRAPRIRPVRTVNHILPDYSGNVDVEGFDGSGVLADVEELQGRTPGHIIRDEGDDLPQRPWLDFVGDGVTATDFGGVTRVNIPGGGGAGADDGEIDVFTGIVDDTAAEFVLTYAPRLKTWNVTLNGVGQINLVDYSIDGQTLTVADPTDLFAGASAGDPWTLQVQYHKANNLLTPEPEPPGDAVAVLTSNIATNNTVGQPSTPLDATFPTAPAANSTVLVAVQQTFTDCTVTGLGATWTRLVNNAPGGDPQCSIWAGVGCNGTDTVVTVSVTGNSPRQVGCIETRAVTITGVQTASGTGTVAGPLTAPASGIAFATTSRGNLSSELPSAWTTVHSGSKSAAILLDAADAASRTFDDAAGVWAMVLLDVS